MKKINIDKSQLNTEEQLLLEQKLDAFVNHKEQRWLNIVNQLFAVSSIEINNDSITLHISKSVPLDEFKVEMSSKYLTND